MEQPPIGTEIRLAEYLYRQLSILESGINSPVPKHYKAMPLRPIVGNLYYFDNVVLPTITSIGLWIYKATGWVKII